MSARTKAPAIQHAPLVETACRPSRVPRSPGGRMTSLRQRQLAALIDSVAGLSTQQIADRLGLPYNNTLKTLHTIAMGTAHHGRTGLRWTLRDDVRLRLREERDFGTDTHCSPDSTHWDTDGMGRLVSYCGPRRTRDRRFDLSEGGA